MGDRQGQFEGFHGVGDDSSTFFIQISQLRCLLAKA